MPTRKPGTKILKKKERDKYNSEECIMPLKKRGGSGKTRWKRGGEGVGAKRRNLSKEKLEGGVCPLVKATLYD